MNFSAPIFLWGLVFSAVPLAIHLIGRRTSVQTPFAPYEFLAEVMAQMARRERLRQWLLLALRLLAVVFLAFALSTPTARSQVAVAPKGETLIVIDASPSMAYRLANASLLERAKGLARNIIADRPEGRALVVVAAEAPSPSLPGPSADHSEVQKSIDIVEVAKEASSLELSVRRGVDLFAGAPVDLFVISDLSDNAFTAGAAAGLPNVSSVHLVDAAARGTLAALTNVGLVGVRSEQRSDGSYLVTVRARNFSATEQRAEVRVSLEGVVKARGFFDFAQGETADKEFSFADLSAGLHRGEISLSADGDGFTADDHAAFALEAFAPAKILLVDGQPRSVAYRDELFYVQNALQSAEPPLGFTLITGDDLPTTPLGPFNVVVLANVAAPSTAAGKALAEFVRGGGGLLVGLGDNVDYEKYNASLGEVLPVRLRDQFKVADAKAVDAATSALGLASIEWSHPVFRGFEPEVQQAFFSSRTFRHFFVEADDLAKVKTLVRFSSGAPALIERNRVMLWLSTLDRDWSDFAIRPPFAPLVTQTMRYLAKSLRSAPDESITAGQAVALSVAPNGAPAWVRGLSDGAVAVAANPAEPLVLPQPGLYALFASANAQTPIAGTAFSILPTLAESDFSPVNPRRLEERWGVAKVETDASPQETKSAWAQATDAGASGRSYAPVLLVLLVVAFALQTLVARTG